MDGIANYFKFAERGTNLATEARAGLTTFIVMVYIIFVNASILGAGFGLDPAGVAAVSAGTALIAGIMTIAMGAVANYPFALAAGLGINAIVAFSLTGRGLDARPARWASSCSKASLVTLLVLVGFREAVMNAVPLALKRAIGVGIGLFILFIGFVNGGFIATPQGGVPLGATSRSATSSRSSRRAKSAPPPCHTRSTRSISRTRKATSASPMRCCVT